MDMKVNKHQQEILEGYVVDLACIRSYPQDELLQRAEVHTKKCSLMGHCVESGYGLVNKNGAVVLLDPKATPKVMDVLRSNSSEQGIYLKVKREMNGEKMETVAVQAIDPK